MFTKRQASIVHTVLNQVNAISGRFLSEYLHVSDRTIRNDVNQINTILKEHDCTISSSKVKGYFITQQNKATIQKLIEECNEYEFDNDDRIFAVIAQILFYKEEITLADIAEHQFVSEQTIYKDIEHIQKLLLIDYNIDLFNVKGDAITRVASEEAIRTMFFKISKKEILTTKQEMPFHLKLLTANTFQENEFLKLEEKIRAFYNQSEIQLSSDSLYMLTWAIYFCILRNEQGFKMEMQQAIGTPDDIILNVIDVLIEQKYALHAWDQILLKNYMKTLGMMKSNHNIVMISDECKKIMYEFSDEILSKYGFDISDNFELYENMQLHIDVMLHRVKVHLQIMNPMLKEVKQKYPYAYEIAMLVVPIVFKQRNEYLQDDEISYIAIYVQYLLESLDIKIKVLIVSGSGAGITKLIKQWVLKNFSDTLEIVECIPSYEMKDSVYGKETNLIISTVPLQGIEGMITYINGIPGVQDYENISTCIKRLRVEMRMAHVVNEICSKQLFKKYHKTEKFETVIAELSMLLYKEDKIAEHTSFTKDVIERESTYPTTVNSYMMIPHPLKESAKKDAVAIAILEEGLQHNPQMKCILLLALNSEKKQDLDILFHIINLLANDVSNITELMRSNQENIISNLLKIAERK